MYGWSSLPSWSFRRGAIFFINNMSIKSNVALWTWIVIIVLYQKYYTCMVELIGHVGNLDEAKYFTNHMPI